jgi:hypothetical protein
MLDNKYLDEIDESLFEISHYKNIYKNMRELKNNEKFDVFLLAESCEVDVKVFYDYQNRVDTTENFKNRLGLLKDKGLGIQWGKPIPFDEYIIPEYPIESFNSATWIKNCIEEIAESTQTDPALAGTTMLSVLATCVQNKYQIKMNSNWKEPLSLYTICSMEPSERKSSVFNKLTEPISFYEINENEIRKPLIEKNTSDKNLLLKKIEHQEKLIVKGDRHSEGAEQKHRELKEELEKFIDIKRVNLTLDDVTPEKLVNSMCENEGNMSIMSSEGGIIGTLSGRYSKNGNVNTDIFLKGFFGEPTKVDRQGKPSVNLPRPALTMGLSMQPVVLNSFIENKELREKGLCARFLYSTPKSFVGSRKYEAKKIDDSIFYKYKNNITDLLKIPYASKLDEPTSLTLTQDAKKVSEELFYYLEPKMKKGSDLEHLKDIVGKLHGIISRIAGLLHIAENLQEIIKGDNPFMLEISAETYQKAIALGEYYLQNAIPIFSNCSANEELANTKYLLEKIKAYKMARINKRIVHQKTKGKLKEVGEFDKALQQLQELSYIELEITGGQGAGRKSTDILVNPILLE